MNVLFEDERFLAVDKPSGLLSARARGNEAAAPTLAEVVAAQLGTTPLWVVHRLDRETSGVVLLAKNATAHRAACLAFEARRVAKRYLLLAARPPDPPAGVVQAALAPDPRRARRGAMAVAAHGKPATTRYQTLATTPAVTLVAAWPETGRTHQIRVHMAHLGAPVLQDERYGAVDPALPLARLALHAADLAIPSLCVFATAPWPEDLREVWPGPIPTEA